MKKIKCPKCDTAHKVYANKSVDCCGLEISGDITIKYAYHINNFLIVANPQFNDTLIEDQDNNKNRIMIDGVKLDLSINTIKTIFIKKYKIN